MKPLIILACDPSFTAFGYVILTGKRILEQGCIQTKTDGKKRRIRKSDEDIQRVKELGFVLLSAIKMNNVNYMVAEAPHGSQSAVAAKMLGAVTALLETMSMCLEIPIEWFSEGDAKMALHGAPTASKKSTIKKIGKLYEVAWNEKEFANKVEKTNEAIADALAIHFVACQQSPTIKFLSDKKNADTHVGIGLVLDGKAIENAIKQKAGKHLADKLDSKILRRTRV